MWLIREVLSREACLARALVSSASPALANLLREVSAELGVPVQERISAIH
ncbi:hypothetical protein ACCUM_1419 [Candidatus Accumulibacter phosphatis]|uniref:Uncharacterized protein n=1 Tax=Candidatus Accumulibacter phosphatis TaxID=327160 RepID=A0A5S4EJ89_9PROT|nr:hypothetical protein ACCUM_1419 [Candidatus Accumulibacter phosphatis]